jgi:hypothetical protein
MSEGKVALHDCPLPRRRVVWTARLDRSIDFPDQASFVSVVRVAAALQPEKLFCTIYKQELLASYST